MKRGFGILAIAILGIALSGCFRAKPVAKAVPAPAPAPAPVEAVENPQPPPPKENPNPGGGGVFNDPKRVIQKADAMNQLKNIAMMYVQYSLENNQPPASQKDLMEYLKTSAGKEYKSLEEGYFTVVPKAKTASGVVVAYEQTADRGGSHFVAMGDGSVQKMTTQDLRAALGMR
jgi:hypothetical protein